MSELSSLTEALIRGNVGRLIDLVNEELEAGKPASELFSEVSALCQLDRYMMIQFLFSTR